MECSIIDNGNSSVLTIINTSGYNGYQYRCIVYNNLPSSDTSQSALLTVGTGCIPISIISNSGGQSVVTDCSSITITTTGTSPTYQWQLLIPGGSWTNLIPGGNLSWTKWSKFVYTICEQYQR
ncbi:MAG: hypothetical protein IPH33_15490 [Bacteroidetes bacterium]|nr:hypothetical protein [Bacteroidota bacterium]